MSEILWNGIKCYDQKVSPVSFNRLVDACQSLTLEPGLGYGVNRSLAGTVLQIKPASNAGSARCPLSISIAPISGDPTSITVNVSPGTVGGLVPSNIFDTFTVSKSETVYVKATASSDGASVTSVSISADTDTPAAQTPAPFALPSSCEVLLGLVQSGRAYRTIECGSVALVGLPAFHVDKTSPAEPGQSVVTEYFIWQVSTF